MDSDQGPEARLKSALANRYRIEQEVGSGGMATVFLAEDLKYQRRVAVKVLRPELSNSVGVERFLRDDRRFDDLLARVGLPAGERE